MSYRALLWGACLGLLLPAGVSAQKKPTRLTGILGESAIFQLQSPEAFGAVLWGRNDVQLATLKKGPSCQVLLFKEYTGREVRASQDCSSLTVLDLRKEDAGEYKAQFLKLDSLQAFSIQTFILEVDKRLSEADLEVTCAKDDHKNGNKTLHLNCSVGRWGDGVNFSWSSPGWTGPVFSPEVTLDPEDGDRNLTCTAENRLGSADKTVSLKQVCAAGKHATTRPPSVADRETDPPSPPLAQTIPIAVVLVLLGMAAVAAVVWKCRSRKAAGRELIPPSDSSGPKDRSFYAEIQSVPQIQDMETPPSQRGPRGHQEVPVTIYADVQHPKTPLQTDDEKLRREKRKAAKGEKTIYSEISDPKESDERNLKTIYDTVNLPRPPEASEYNKIL